MATIDKQPMAYHTGLYVTVPITTSAAVHKGMPVVYSSGYAIEASSDSTGILGIALADAASGDDVLVILATPATIFVGNVYHGTEASAITAVTQRGTAYSIYVASYMAHVAIDDTSNHIVKVLSLYPEDTVADIYGRVLFKFTSYGQVDSLS